MKKILIFLFIVFSIGVYGQTLDEFNVTETSESDTTIYLRNSRHNLLTIDFTTVNSSTSTLDVGFSDDRVSFVSATVSGVTFPVTLDKTTYTKTANGYTRNRIAFMSSDWPGTCIALKITLTGTTAGVYKITY